MKTVTIRAHGDDLVVDIPGDMASVLNWDVGTTLIVERVRDVVMFRERQCNPRGAWTVSELLDQIDRDEIKMLNASIGGFSWDAKAR
ncbi:antitoxin [Enterobacter sp. PTB]|uniref:antitoxin n=1 Tax=Enterobacter sp. PTB TaxID=3143437 RepID=UPI003DA93BCC